MPQLDKITFIGEYLLLTLVVSMMYIMVSLLLPLIFSNIVVSLKVLQQVKVLCFSQTKKIQNQNFLVPLSAVTWRHMVMVPKYMRWNMSLCGLWLQLLLLNFD